MTRASDVAKLITSGGTIVDGNIAFADGHGIDFSATADTSGMTSELLDDYEEGTWTPTASDAATGGNTSSTGDGRYTKIGRMVFVHADMLNVNIASMTSSNNFHIQGLPFANNGTVRACSALQVNAVDNGDDIFAHLGESASAFTFKHNNSSKSNGSSSILVSDLNSNNGSDFFGISLVYTTS
tara:strand:+ start:730 stop:1278 length:549 start_codon:yes stop_codon:yes gene_type:complete